MKVTFRYDIDFQGLLKESERQDRRTLYRVGGLTRSGIRRNVKRRKKPAPPGRPPHHHVRGRGGLKFVLYAVNLVRKNVIIGPARTPSKGSRPAPGVQEAGGTTYIKVRRRGVFRSNIGPHPFVGPVFKELRPRFVKIHADNWRYRGRNR